MDDISALLKGRNKELVEIAKKVMKKLKDEVEKKGIKLSVNENGKEGKNKMIVSCGFLEDELRQCSKEEGVTMADSLETLGVDLRTRVKRGSERKSEEKEVQSEILANTVFQKSCMTVEVKKLLRAGMMPARTWGVHAVGLAPTERLKLRRQMAAAVEKKRVQPRSLFSWKHTALKWKESSRP